eukprot:CAMPEP_0119334920 /NCGR_PEP_ID=MMETSP1333-20130426/88321_1 /TAXON_ID=418940 /ORGANISM="Scyphosphaera apsteinii, Strain RCC1455" /LENGTH=39 /DNA_ID= /DNA_START= /DNA_END= /DNA_ORIENTATION=
MPLEWMWGSNQSLGCTREKVPDDADVVECDNAAAQKRCT